MNFEIVFRGLVVGLLASITLGPVGVMCIQRTLSKSRASGFVSGLGAATADTIFATLAYFFVAVISSVIENNLQTLKIVGGVFVMGVGMYFFLKNPVVQIRRNRAGKSNLGQDYASTFVLTLTNPGFILWLLVVFSAFNLGGGSGDAGAASEMTPSHIGTGAQMILGFFGGAAAWWLALTAVVGLFRRNFRPRYLLWINRGAGAAIVSLGVAAIVSAFVF
ncbi:MAG: LysE family transporter [Alistipes sp.]|jgi:threonine/homoserine/homoserine lactone efflux protein|nr:LysE family transporter [Alistipes sp.]